MGLGNKIIIWLPDNRAINYDVLSKLDLLAAFQAAAGRRNSDEGTRVEDLEWSKCGCEHMYECVWM